MYCVEVNLLAIAKFDLAVDGRNVILDKAFDAHIVQRHARVQVHAVQIVLGHLDTVRPVIFQRGIQLLLPPIIRLQREDQVRLGLVHLADQRFGIAVWGQYVGYKQCDAMIAIPLLGLLHLHGIQRRPWQNVPALHRNDDDAGRQCGQLPGRVAEKGQRSA